MDDLRSTSNPSFWEYEESFQKEGVDFGSYNPVTVEELVTNCQQFVVDDKLRPSVVLGAVGSQETFDDSEMCINFCEDSTNLFTGRPIGGGASASPHQWIAGETHLPSSNPTFYAPLFPIVHMPTHFETRFEPEKVVQQITEFLENKYSFRFLPSEGTWNCCFLDGPRHGTFVVRIYRFSKKSGKTNHAIELQRIDGDAWVFRSVYETLHELLVDETIVVPEPIWPRPVDWPVPATAVETTYVSEPLETKKPQTEAIEPDPHSFEVPSMDNLLEVIIATLEHGRKSAILESTQLLCSIYSVKPLLDPNELDIRCMRKLMEIVNFSETNSEWESQHAVWALACMSYNTKYCQEMLASGELGKELLKAMLALAVPRTFTTYTMRCKCVELLTNLIKANSEYVFTVLEEADVVEWQAKEFTQEALKKSIK